MRRNLTAAFYLTLLFAAIPAIVYAGGSLPPGPSATTCSVGGTAFTAYAGGASQFTCGTPIASGTINTGAAGQIADYTAATTVSPITTGTGVVAALGVNTGSAGAFLVNGGVLGTPSSGTATNLTGLPISTGVSGLGTGVATALAVNVGSAGAPVVLNGALGTPSSGTLTSATGLPISTGISGLGTGVATAAANNLSANAGLTKTVFSGAKAMGTSAISSAACATLVTDTATGTLTTDVVLASFNGDPTAVTGYVPATAGMLTIIIYPTADTVNFKVCNNTSSSITPGAITLNWRVVR